MLFLPCWTKKNTIEFLRKSDNKFLKKISNQNSILKRPSSSQFLMCNSILWISSYTGFYPTKWKQYIENNFGFLMLWFDLRTKNTKINSTIKLFRTIIIKSIIQYIKTIIKYKKPIWNTLEPSSKHHKTHNIIHESHKILTFKAKCPKPIQKT